MSQNATEFPENSRASGFRTKFSKVCRPTARLSTFNGQTNMRAIPGLFLLVAVILTMPVRAEATPITPGQWSDIGVAAYDGAVFWDNPSVDCGFCSAGELLDLIYGPLEFFHDGSNKAAPFAFTGPISYTKVGALTAWKNGTFTHEADGSFTYDNGLGFVANSLTSQQFALFRKAGPDTTQYFIGVEDIALNGLLASDADYNDYIATFTVTNVPEPGTLLLMGTALGAAARRLRRKRR